MPMDFEMCMKNGGRMITKKVGKDKYMHICYDKDNKSHAGEVKTKKGGVIR